MPGIVVLGRVIDANRHHCIVIGTGDEKGAVTGFAHEPEAAMFVAGAIFGLAVRSFRKNWNRTPTRQHRWSIIGKMFRRFNDGYDSPHARTWME